MDPYPSLSSPPSDPMDVDTTQTHATPPHTFTPAELPGGGSGVGGLVAPMETDPSPQATHPGNGVNTAESARIGKYIPTSISTAPQPPQATDAMPEGAGDEGQEMPMDTDTSMQASKPGKEEESGNEVKGEGTPTGSEGHTPLSVRNGVDDSSPGEAVTPAGQTIVAPPQMHTGASSK